MKLTDYEKVKEIMEQLEEAKKAQSEVRLCFEGKKNIKFVLETDEGDPVYICHNYGNSATKIMTLLCDNLKEAALEFLEVEINMLKKEVEEV